MIKSAVSYSEHETNDKNTNTRRSEFSGTLVKIQDYNPAHHSLKVVKLADGKPLIEQGARESKINKAKPFEQPNSISFKTLKAPDGPIVEVNDSQASVRGSSNDGFYSSREFGNIVKGPTSFSAMPHEIRVSGLMTLHPLLTSGFPSTIVTPIPTLQWSLPSAAMLAPIAKDVALMSALVGLL